MKADPAADNDSSLKAEPNAIMVLASKQVDMSTARAAADAMRRQLKARHAQ